MSEITTAELIKRLHEHAAWAAANEYETPICLGDDLRGAADLIESLQAQLAKYDEVAAEYGIDCKTMLTLAKSQIKTAQDNIKLQEQLAASQRRERAAVEDMEHIANHKISMCAICKHNDVFWTGSGCNLQNAGEPCYFSYGCPQEAGKGGQE